jgi:hypothetical protein
MNILKWIQNWYLENCDGDWEHCYGVNISTLDNPGWTIDIDLTDTNIEDKKFEVIDIERSESDWIYCNVSDNTFHGNGGPNNLEEILMIFQSWVAGVAK